MSAREVTCFSRFGYARPWIYPRVVVVWDNKTCCNEVTIDSDFDLVLRVGERVMLSE